MRPVTVDIYDEVSTKAVSGKSVLQALGPARDAKEILVRMNSPGGDVTEGLAIYSLLLEQRKSGVNVVCRIDGLCASIATVIACAANTVEMAENAFYCIHDPMNGGNLSGATSADLRERADLLDSMGNNIVSIYVAKTGLPEKQIRELMADDRIITAEKAKALGFVDKILPANLKAVASIRLDRLPKHLSTQVPQALSKAKAKMEELEDIKAAIAELKASYDKLSQDIASLKPKADEDTGEPDGDEDGGGESDADGDEPKKEEAKAAARIVQTAIALTGQKNVKKLEGALMALSAKAMSTGVSAHADSVSKAIQAGKLLPAMKAQALKMSPENFSEYLALMGDIKLGPVGKEFQPEASKAAELVAATGVVINTKKTEEVSLTPDEIALARQLGSGVADPLAFARTVKAKIAS